MQLPPYYRLWIYSTNGLLILIQLIFVFCSYSVFSHQWIKYFPFGWPNWLVILTYASVGVQFIVCVGGILGALLFSKTILRIYWLFMIPLLVFDLIKAICWVIQFRDMHRQYPVFIEGIVNLQIHSAENNATSLCSEWATLQLTMKCCAPENIHQLCDYTESRWDELEMSKYADLCSSRKLYSCANPLLRWFHGQTDFLAIIAYFVLFPLKLIVVVVLRKDIQELFGEIVYAGNQHLYRQYRHWAAIDPPERFNNDLSSSLQFSMETITSTTALMEPQKVLKE
ncbi:unnamed protein product [Toxocara canis]|uniref:Tetraspanin n=1 Tax=Toxocara canis TaxID=6265 RepID=A0A183UFX6_TOXCA|nr:unnamed protein product [Toxocara canis]